MSTCVSDLGDLVGLDGAKRLVRKVLSEQSGVHAVLFYGPEGAGKSQLAAFLAKSWLCMTPLDDGTACCDCAVCSSFDAGRAVDYQFVPPWGPSSIIKLSSLMPTPQWEKDKDRPNIDFILDFFRTKALMARHKVVMFDRVDRMNADTANAFLKTLEEPATGVKVIMASHEFTKILPTIRSRCMCVACELPGEGSATSATDGGTPVESVFGGSPGGVAHIRAHHDCFQRLYDLLESSRHDPWGSAFKLAEGCREVSEEYAKSASLGPRTANVKVLEAVSRWLALNFPERPDILKKVAEAHRLVLGNAQPGLVFEDLFLSLLYDK